MKRLFKLILFLVVIGALAVVVNAYLGDLSPNRVEVNQPVELDGN